MSAIAAISLGNSSVKCGLWSEERFSFLNRLAISDLEGGRLFPGAGELPEVAIAAVASVVPAAEPVLEKMVKQELGLPPRWLGRDLDPLLMTDAASAGADRLAAALAAHRRFGAAVIVDFGTAITVNAVTADGRFLGGAILPGPALAAEALSSGTARVRVSVPSEAVEPPGDSTEKAVVAGITHGLAGAVDRLVERTAAALGGSPALVATGGATELLLPLCRTRFELAPDLVLEGLVVAAQDALGRS